MELRTYTGLWAVEKRLYKFYDIDLPTPISVKQLGVFAASIVPWFTVMHFIHMPIGKPYGFIIWFFPPLFLTWWGNRPVAESKSLTSFLSCQIRYFFAPKNYASLTAIEKELDRIEVSAAAWTLQE
jgi:hypothetical protein